MKSIQMNPTSPQFLDVVSAGLEKELRALDEATPDAAAVMARAIHKDYGVELPQGSLDIGGSFVSTEKISREHRVEAKKSQTAGVLEVSGSTSSEGWVQPMVMMVMVMVVVVMMMMMITMMVY